MNSKRIHFILFVILAQALAACGTATPVAVPTTTPPPTLTATPTGTPEPADPAEIAQSFYKAVNARDIEAAMTLVADDVKCRGNCYLTGKQSFQSFIQGSINVRGQVEISDLTVEGDQVTYNWTAYSDAGFFQARGVETLQIKDGKIIFMQSEIQ